MLGYFLVGILRRGPFASFFVLLPGLQGSATYVSSFVCLFVMLLVPHSMYAWMFLWMRLVHVLVHVSWLRSKRRPGIGYSSANIMLTRLTLFSCYLLFEQMFVH